MAGLLSAELGEALAAATRLSSKLTTAVEPSVSYLELIAGLADFFRTCQASDGRIIDPYAQKEIQYSTPCYAWSCAVLITGAQRSDLIESASLALDSSLTQLAEGTCAEKHGDFYTFPAVQAYEALKSVVPLERKQKWDALLSAIDPYKAYQSHLKNDPTVDVEWTKKYTAAKMNNWNLVNVAGEFLRFQNGFVPHLAYIDEHLAVQLTNLSQEGLYLDPHSPTAYDHFPRHFLCAMLHRGYNGAHRAALEEKMEAATLVSLLLQSPLGELPTGGRSSQHQWNEAQQCVSYEIWARRKKAEGQPVLAGAFKRAARLARASLAQWVRPSGEFWIVKNRCDPAQRHGFEAYSFHSQYNLLAASMLVSAWTFADSSIEESAALSEVGGFVAPFPILHKVIGNCGGLYVEIDTAAEAKYDSTGLIRVHRTGVNALVGPSAGGAIDQHSAAIGVGWEESDGKWTYLSALPEGRVTGSLVSSHSSADRVEFTVKYTVKDSRVSEVSEKYEMTPTQVRVTVETTPPLPLRAQFPAFVTDGERHSTVTATGAEVTVQFAGSQQTFALVEPAGVQVRKLNAEPVASRNGFLDVYAGDALAPRVIFTLTPTTCTTPTQ